MLSTYSQTAEYTRYSDFFSRLAAGDHQSLTKDMTFTKKPWTRSAVTTGTDKTTHAEVATQQPREESRPQTLPSGSKTACTMDDDHQEYTLKLMLHSLYSLADFAKMVSQVVSDSQASFQPLPEILRGRRMSGTSGPLDTEAALRAVKKRRIRAVNGSAINEQTHGVAICGDSSHQPEHPEHANILPPSSSRSRCSSESSTTESQASYDEETVLKFTRDLCEIKAVVNMQQGKEGNRSPPPSPSCIEPATLLEGAHPSAHLRPTLKRRLSN